MTNIRNTIFESLGEGLDKWFDEKWVDISRKKKGGGHPPCGDSHDKDGRPKDDERAYPKCVPKAKAEKMSKKEKESAVRRKRRAVNKKGDSKKPTYVSTKKESMTYGKVLESLMSSYTNGVPNPGETALFFELQPEGLPYKPEIGRFYRDASAEWYGKYGSSLPSEELPQCVRDNAAFIAEATCAKASGIMESADMGSMVESVEGDHITLIDGYTPIEIAEGAMLERLSGGSAVIAEAVYDGRKVELNKPKRGGSKKFYVYVNSGKKTKDGKIKAKKVSFGSDSMEIKRDDPEARKSFRARHNCSDKKDRKTAGYWSCKMWQKGTSVSDMLSK